MSVGSIHIITLATPSKRLEKPPGLNQMGLQLGKGAAGRSYPESSWPQKSTNGTMLQRGSMCYRERQRKRSTERGRETKPVLYLLRRG